MEDKPLKINNPHLFNEAESFSRDVYLPIEMVASAEIKGKESHCVTDTVTPIIESTEKFFGNCEKNDTCQNCSNYKIDGIEFRKSYFHLEDSHIKKDSYIIRACKANDKGVKPFFTSQFGLNVESIPKNVVERSNLSNSTIAYIISEKFIYKSSLEDISKSLQEYGVTIPMEHLCDLVISVSRRMARIISHMKEDLLSCPVIYFDYIPARSVIKQYIWVIKGKTSHREIVLLGNSPFFPGFDARKWFYGYSGFLCSKGFDRYSSFQFGNNVFPLSELREYFLSCDQSILQPSCIAEVIIYFDKIMDIDRYYKSLLINAKMSVNEFLLSRNSEIRPVFKELLNWLTLKYSIIPHDTPFGNAISFALYHLESSSRFLDHFLLSPHMDETEIELLPFSNSESGWTFSQACHQARYSFDLYSILRTGILNGLDPNDYLLRSFSALSSLKSNEVVSDILPYK